MISENKSNGQLIPAYLANRNLHKYIACPLLIPFLKHVHDALDLYPEGFYLMNHLWQLQKNHHLIIMHTKAITSVRLRAHSSTFAKVLEYALGRTQSSQLYRLSYASKDKSFRPSSLRTSSINLISLGEHNLSPRLRSK